MTAHEQTTEPLRPENFDLYHPELIDDPWAGYSRLREQCPVFHSERVGWVLTGYDDVSTASRDYEGFRSDWGPKSPTPRNLPRTREEEGGEAVFSYAAYPVLPIETDPPVHGGYRRLLQPLFTAPSIERNWGDDIRSIAHDLVTAYVRDGGGDFVESVALPMSGLAVAAVLGIPREQRDEFQQRALLLARETGPALEFLEGAIESAQSGAFHVLATAEIDGRELTREEKLGYGLILVHAGWETTAGTLTSMVHRLATQPELRAALTAQPELLATAPDEFIRIDAAAPGLWRTAGEDREVGGCPIKRGDKVLLMWGAANRDPAAFEGPDEVRLDRKPNRHMSFGEGVHRCLGSALARAEITAVLAELMAAPALVRDESVPVERIAGAVPVITKLVLRPGR
ncbi:MAG: hypothetical protein ABS81_10225 [Pseudonocardia sp. SCN 72-86]|nr:MAG: hypothetical protein ABS81_10225 [Pseudonocardia sp. SCN 72-86]